MPLNKLRRRFLSRFGRKRRSRARSSRFEQLEVRRLLAPAVWNNAANPLDVNGDALGLVTPADALTVIHELNFPKWTEPATGLLPRQLDAPQNGPYVDVSCDGFVSPRDALQVIAGLNAGERGGELGDGSGTYASVSCSPQLLEGDEFVSQLTRRMVIPNSQSAIEVTFRQPEFDLSSSGLVRDAFEIEITDAEGNAVTFPYTAGRDAIYNWSEGLTPEYGPTVETTLASPGEDSTATIHLAGLPPGTQVDVTVRLVNNDRDDATSAIVRGFEFVDATQTAPAGVVAPKELAAPTAFVDVEQLDDITGSITVGYGRTTLDGDNNELRSELTIANQGNRAVMGPIIVAIGNISELEAAAMNPDGFLPDGRPFFDFTPQMQGQPLLPNQSLSHDRFAFKNNSGQRFTYELRGYGRLNAAPSGFDSQPVESIEAGRSYRYIAQASDPENQPLRYSLITGPREMVIDSDSGLLQWTPSGDDVGLHQVTIRATDPYGLSADQRFTIEVLETQQNRPPNFVSDPVTEAVASSGFEITTVATGVGPAGVAAITGPRGPRLVSIDAGEQTLSVVAGEGNDRFDERTTVSTGEPVPSDSLFDVGESIDVGLPAFESTRDSNDVTGLDQGDLNGDGILDLVVMTRVNPLSPELDYVQITRMLGDGNGGFGSPLELARVVTTNEYRNLVVADINHDGVLDVMALERRTSTFVSMLGRGDGSFAPPVSTLFDVNLDDFRVVDLDQDGLVDLVGRRGQVGFGVVYDLVWKRGRGDGTFGPVQDIVEAGSVPTASVSVQARPYQVVDIDGDVDQDIVLANYTTGSIDVLLNDGNQQFTLGVSVKPATGSLSSVLQVGDFNSDGTLDLLAVNRGTGRVDLFAGDESGVNFTRTEGVGVYSRSGNLAGSDQPVDIDGDGDLDLGLGAAVTSNPLSPQILRNDGTGRFVRTDYPMVDFPGHVSEDSRTDNDVANGVMFGDYNRDGVIDFVYSTAGQDFNGVGIRLGSRPGEFGATRTIEFVSDSFSYQTLAADFNADGINDLLALRADQMFLGVGDGTYQPPFPATGVSRPASGASVADFNLDGLPDIVAPRANTKGSRYYVALGNGDGTFTVSDDQPVENSFYGYDNTAIADFNGDGYPDFVAKDAVARHLDVHLNDPDNPGTFERSFRVTTVNAGINVGNFERAYAVGDFNEDGIVDLVISDRLSGEPLKLITMLGDGTGDFPDTVETFAYDIGGFSGDPGDLVAGDLNEDGILDLVTFSTQGPIVHLGNGDGSFRTTDQYPSHRVASRSRDSYIVDFDEDGHLDLVQSTGTGSSSGTLLVRRGLGDGTFAEADRVGLQGGGQEFTFADLDHDGHLDLAYTVGAAFNYITSDAALYFGKRNGLVDLLAVDLNGDGNQEILAVNEANDRLKLFVGDNLGGLTRRPDLFTGRAPRAVEAADLDGDGQPELITANRSGRSLSVFRGDLEAGYTSTEFPVGSGLVDVAAADLDNDGDIDLVALDDVAKSLWIVPGNGTPTLDSPVAVTLGDSPGRLVLNDVSGDGSVDVIVTLPESNRLMILPGNGQGGFESPVYVSLDGSPADLAVVDLNDDGHADIAVTLPAEDALSILYGRGNLQFAKPQQIGVGRAPTRITAADMDEDGRTDLLVANSEDATASVIYNRFDPNEVYRYDADAIDPDGDELTYSIDDGPGGLLINRATGALLWAAAPDQVGAHEVTIRADDGRGGSATQTFRIDVQPARENAEPLFATEPPAVMGAGETYRYQALAVDSDGDALRYRIVDGPAGATIDPTTGLLKWDGRSDQAMIFAPNGQSGSIRVPADPSLKPESITVEGWYQLHSLPRYNTLMADTGRNGWAYLVQVFEYDQWLKVALSFDDNADRIQFYVPMTPVVDRWYHIALTYDAESGTAILYVDGVPVGSGTTPNPQPLALRADADTMVGWEGASPTQATIDNYRIWNVARSEAEIREGMSRQYDGDSRLVLDYRFDLPNTRTVRDFSAFGNDGYLVRNLREPQLVTGLADTGIHSFTIGVEDGRGGFDTQSFDIEILPELRGEIVGRVFDDFDGDGVQDDGSENPAEPSLSGWQLYLDTNGNSYPDPGEQFATSDANGDYRFDGLLPGLYPVRVAPVAGYATPPAATVPVAAGDERVLDLAIEQLSLGQIGGRLSTETGDAVARARLFADLNQNGLFDAGEPTTESDRDGNYALTGLTAGEYRVHAELFAGWEYADDSGAIEVTLVENEVSTDNDVVLKPTSTTAREGVRFVTTPLTSIEARSTYRYASVATNLSGQPMVYDLPLAPDGMTINPNTGLIAWRPTIEQVGDHTVVVRATTESGAVGLHDYSVRVTSPNTAPEITSLPAQIAYVGSAYEYDVRAQDADLQQVVYSLTTSPPGAEIAPNTGLIGWVPSASDVGQVEFGVTVSDTAGAATTVNWTVDVRDGSPAIFPLNVAYPRSHASVGNDYLSRISAVDQLDRPVRWTLSSGPEGMSVDTDGTIRWRPASSQLGDHSIELAGTTADGSTESVSFSLEVLGRAKNRAPSIESTPTTSVLLGHSFSYDVTVTDSDGDIFSFALLESPFGMSIDPARGTIRWTPSVDQMGESDVVVQVSDPSGGTAEQAFTLQVSRYGGPPRIDSIPPTEAAVGSAYRYTVDARDSEGDPLAYGLLAAPAGMRIVETTGEVLWTPTSDQVGPQDVVIQVVDGIGGAATQVFTVDVKDGVPNATPTITSSSPRFGSAGALYRYQLQATDPEETTITYTLGQGPSGMVVDSTTGMVTWTPTAAQVGKTVVTYVATDSGGASAIESFEFDVLAENQLPTVESSPPGNVVAGVSFNYQVLARDADFDQLSFSLKTAPAGAEIDPFGRITWPTSGDSIGTHDFVVAVADSREGVTRQAFTLEVTEDTVPPRLSLIEDKGDGNRNILPWQGPFTVYVKATDDVAVASVTLTANGQAVPLDAFGTATFRFEDWGFARIDATATAVDTSGNTTTQTIRFDYDFPEGWTGAGSEDIPTAEISSPADTDTVTGMVAIRGTAAHDDFAAYKLQYRRIDDATFTAIVQSDTPITDGELGVWDTSRLPNDEYVIRLEVATRGGVVNVVERNVGLAGELKLGNFRVSFTDLVIPVAGIPLEITRVYDTLQADREGDFGYGWRLEYRDTDLRVGLPKTGLEDIGIYSPLRPGVKVYLNISGEGRQGFTFDPEIRVLPGWGGTNLVLARPRFTSDSGVTSTLSTGTSNYLQVNDRGELFAPGGVPYNPASPSFGGAYVVTTRDGVIYRIDGATGQLSSVRDRNGNTLTFTEAGIESSAGTDVAIQRDAAGRIVAIVDPSGSAVKYGYSPAGDLASVVDREGNETRYQYRPDPAHYLAGIIDPLGREGVRVDYDEEGRMVRVVDAGGNPITISYDPGNSLQTTTDPLGNVTVLEYDNRGNVVAVTDALGGVVRYTFDDAGNETSVTDPLGRTTTTQYDSFGNPIRVTRPSGATIVRTYSSFGELTSETDELGNTTTNRFSRRGNLTERVNALGQQSTISYDSDGLLSQLQLDDQVTYGVSRTSQLPTVIDLAGIGTTRIEYDDSGLPARVSTIDTEGTEAETLVMSVVRDRNGRPTQVTTAEQGTTVFEYDAIGNLVRSTDALGRSTDYSYNERNQLTRTIFPDGTEELRSYDGAGRLIGMVDRGGRETRFERDALGRTVATFYPDDTPEDFSDNPHTTTTFDAVGQVVATMDELGRTTRFSYDLSGNVVSQTDPLGNSVQFAYDAADRLVAETDPLGNVTQFSYDALGRIVAIRYADGATESYQYDGRGNLIGTTTAGGESSFYEYDNQSALVRVTNALGAVTSYNRDPRGRITSYVDAENRTTRFELDDAGRITARILPDGARETFSYDAVGQLVSSTDFAGDTTFYEYDENGRVAKTTYPDGRVNEASYTPTGQIKQRSEGTQSTVYQYDERERLTRKTDPDGQSITYEYDRAGNVLSIESPAGRLSYGYDATGNVTQMVAADGTTSFQYDAAGRRVGATLPNGVRETTQYDARSRIARREWSNALGQLQAFDNEYDANGRLVSQSTADGRTQVYRYDAGGQLASETVIQGGVAVRTIAYRYDKVGNRVQRDDSTTGGTVYDYDLRDRLITEENSGVVTTRSYDVNGNLRTLGVDGDEQARYRWDAANRLVQSSVARGTGVETVDYVYSPDGERYLQSAGGIETRWIVDTRRELPVVLAEIEEASTRAFVRPADGLETTALVDDAQTTYLHSDAKYTTRMTTDADGAVVDHIQYDAFGNLADASTAPTVNVLFNGEMRDASGLDYVRARYYEPQTGRFVSMDPFAGVPGIPATLNKYVFAQNDTPNLTDPSGEFTLSEQQATYAIVGGLTALGAGYGYARAKITGQDVLSNVLFYGLAGFVTGVGVVAFGPSVVQLRPDVVVGTITTRTQAGHVVKIVGQTVLSRRITSYVAVESVVSTFGYGVAAELAGAVVDVLFFGISEFGRSVRDGNSSRNL